MIRALSLRNVVYQENMMKMMKPARRLCTMSILSSLATIPASSGFFYEGQLLQSPPLSLLSSYKNGAFQSKALFLSTASTPLQNEYQDLLETSGPFAVRSQKPLSTDSPDLQMLSFYRFEPISRPIARRDELFDAIKEIPGLRGTVYLAQEGINAQLAVPPSCFDDLLQACSSSMPFNPFGEDGEPNLGDVVPVSTPTFNKLIVRIRDYVLRDGIPNDIDLDWTDAGLELDAKEWHKDLNSSSTSLLIDCRNLYESDQGTFCGATPLGTEIFQDSWGQLDSTTENLSKDEPLYIFCTGGIRCVKVGAYLKQHLGFDNVIRLKHGIVGYKKWLEENPQESSVWEGENFLFDKRRFEENDKSNEKE